MTYTIESFTSDTIAPDDFERIETFLCESVNLSEPASVNMFWELPGLLQNIHTQTRWTSDQGAIYLVLKYNQIIGVSCVEYPEGSREFAIGGIRTYIDPQHRSSGIVGLILEQQTNWALDRQCQFMIVTFNDYNRVAHTAVGMSPKYRRAAGWSSWWDDCYPVPEPLNIRNTLQWAVIKPVLNLNAQENCQALLTWAINTSKQ